MEVKDISLNKISFRDNSRQKDVLADQSNLMNSIKSQGLMQPIGLQKNGKKDRYYIVWGHRRYLAFQKLGYKTIPAVLLKSEKLSEEDFIIRNTQENIQRHEISVLELGRVCSYLRKTMSASEIASRLSVAKSKVDTVLRVYNDIPKVLQDKIKFFSNEDKAKGRAGKVPAAIAMIIAGIKGLNKSQKIKLYEITIREDLTFEQMRIVAILHREGLSIDKALKKCKDYRSISIKLAIKTDVYKKLKKKYGHSISKFFAEKTNEDYPNSVFTI